MDPLWKQKLKIAALRQTMLKALQESGETDISIIIATLAEMISTASDWNLEAERKQARESVDAKTTIDVKV